MTIQKDAGNLLIFIYQVYLNNRRVDPKKIIDTTKWDVGRINRAITYLKDLEAIKKNLEMIGFKA